MIDDDKFMIVVDKFVIDTDKFIIDVDKFVIDTDKLCLPPLWWGDILFLSCPSVSHTVCQCNSCETTEQNFMKLGR